jgi:hypothetical protein
MVVRSKADAEAEVAVARERDRAAVARKDEQLRQFIALGESAMKYMIAINGGGCMALLAFISSVYKENPELAQSLVGALAFFGLGVLFSALVSGAACKSRFHYWQYDSETDKEGQQWRKYAQSFGAASYVSFALGGVLTIIALI